MSEVFPISCISCRRKKIKCNKLKPCNQCLKRTLHCEFPSTFRNIKINEEDLDSPPFLKFENIDSLKDEVNLLKNEKYQLLQENIRLSQRNSQLVSHSPSINKDNLHNITKDTLDSSSHEQGLSQYSKTPIPISGETSEMGEKYYGPQSSNFMIEKLKTYSSEDAPTASKIKKHKPNDLFVDSSSESKSNNSFDSDLIEQSLLKKNLPFLLKFDPDLSSDSETFQDLNRLNLQIINKLVELFFQSNFYYKVFISKQNMLEFLSEYPSVKDKEWEHDDDLLLLCMVLILSIQRLTPIECIELNLLTKSSLKNYKQFKSYLTKNVLYHTFEKLRHNLINESIITIQSYILCTEWYFIEQRYEECWSMMFHTCSIAYSIGLHTMGQFRSDSNQHPSEEEDDIARYKVWFALKHLSCQICSILGRPNPISVQVNQLVLKSSNTSSIDLNKRKTQVLLKTGLSECLRLSNLMLIENFMIDFTVNDLLNLDKTFEQEIKLLEWFISDDYLSDEEIESNNSDQLSYDEDSQLPLKIDRNNLLIDLIILYINRAKLFEPFINKFEKSKDEYKLILNNLINSVLKFLDLLILFLESFLISFTEKYNDYELNEEVKIGKLFNVYFPFLNSSIYQGIIVIFTFLHYKFNDFVKNDELTNIEFLKILEAKLNNLLPFDKNISNDSKRITKLWSSNINHLIKKILEHINLIYEKQKLESEPSSIQMTNQFNSQLADPNNDFETFYGLNLSDPFWLTNPESLPSYLNSLSDEGSHSTKRLVKSEEKTISNRSNEENLPPQPLNIQSQQELYNLNPLNINSMWTSNRPLNQSSSNDQHISHHHSDSVPHPVISNPYIYDRLHQTLNFPTSEAQSQLYGPQSTDQHLQQPPQISKNQSKSQESQQVSYPSFTPQQEPTNDPRFSSDMF